MKKLNLIKWALELCNQEGYNSPHEIQREYNIQYRGC